MTKKKAPKKAIDKSIAQALNYIRAYVPTTNITDYLEISPTAQRAIASGKSSSTAQTRRRIAEMYERTKEQVRERQAEFIARSNDKSISKNSRSLARDRARDLAKLDFSFEQANKRQTILREQALPTITASRFLRQYSSGKSEKQLRDELARFTENGRELLVTNVKGNVLFSRKPLFRSSLVHPRGIVYLNNFSAGIDQIVRDLTYMFDNNLSLKNAITEGESYFSRCFKGVNNSVVDVNFLNGGIPQPKNAKTKSRGEKYEDLSKWLAQRLFLGVYLY